jgi:MoxR-like ATPase
LPEISITPDSFFKMALIYKSIISNQPIIICGHTGIGKTALIKLLASTMDANFSVFNIHAGIK